MTLDIHNRLHSEHAALASRCEMLKETATLLDLASVEAVITELEEAYAFLTRELAPHARAEEAVVYRAYDQLAHSPWATDAMRRDHKEVASMADELIGLRLQLFEEAPSDEQKREIRRVLYGLYAILKLHFAKEEELLLPVLEAQLSAEEAEALLASLQLAQAEQLRDQG